MRGKIRSLGWWIVAVLSAATLSAATNGELVNAAKQGDKEEVQHRLEKMALPDLSLLSRELGVSLGKTPHANFAPSFTAQVATPAGWVKIQPFMSILLVVASINAGVLCLSEFHSIVRMLRG